MRPLPERAGVGGPLEGLGSSVCYLLFGAARYTRNAGRPINPTSSRARIAHTEGTCLA